jgi:glucan phosphoethanolaminetransferase (alkaline phosphatase superfamily)
MTRRELAGLLAAATLYCAPAVTMVAWGAADQSSRSLVSVFLAGALIAFAVAGMTRTWRRFFLIQYPVFLFGTAYAAYSLKFGMVPGRALALVLLGSSWEELEGYFLFDQGKSLLLFLIGASAVYLTVSIMAPKTPIFRSPAGWRTRVMVIGLLPVTAYAGWNSIDFVDGLALNPAVGSAMFLGGQIPRSRLEISGAGIRKIPYGAHRSGGEEVHILIVGESVRRESWSAYGYPRPTTPYVSALGSEAILFRNATADANLTTWSVPIILTGADPVNYSLTAVRGNIFDLAREAGYGTAWLVNQDIGISAAVGVAPDRLVYPPDFNADLMGRHARDEGLLPGLRREIGRRGHARFIGIHMMGSHWEYYRRYPPSFQRFGTAADVRALSVLSLFSASGPKGQSTLVDAYDNSILYTDWFLHEVIEQARALDVPATVTYFPDHGEDLQVLDGHSGHGQPIYTPHAFDIPVLIWANEAFRKQHPEIMDALRGNALKQVRSHDVFDTVGQIMGITWPGASPRRSFASPQYVADGAMKHIAGGRLVDRP